MIGGTPCPPEVPAPSNVSNFDQQLNRTVYARATRSQRFVFVPIAAHLPRAPCHPLRARVPRGAAVRRPRPASAAPSPRRSTWDTQLGDEGCATWARPRKRRGACSRRSNSSADSAATRSATRGAFRATPARGAAPAPGGVLTSAPLWFLLVRASTRTRRRCIAASTVSDEEARRLAAALEHATTQALKALEELDLYSNKISDEMRHLGDALARGAAPRLGVTGGARRARRSATRGRATRARCLAEGEVPALEKLDLINNEIGDEAAPPV